MEQPDLHWQNGCEENMSDPFEVLVPLLNTNEPEARLTSLAVKEGQRVESGEVLCTLETTKSQVDLKAERDGYVIGLQANVGEVFRAGERLFWLAGSADWQPSEIPVEVVEEADFPEGLRITQPALALANDAGLDLSDLPKGILVTKSVIQDAIAESRPVKVPEGSFGPQALVVYGGGGHGKSVIDLVRVLGTYEIVGVVDDGLEVGTDVMGLSVIGGAGALSLLRDQGVNKAINAVGGVGDVYSRIRVFERLKNAGFEFPTLMHPTAFVEESAQISDGIQIFPHAYVGSEAKLSFGVIVNTSAVVSHDCEVKEYANIAPGTLLAGGVTIGKGVMIGMGVTINLYVSVGDGAQIGNSAVIKRDVPERAIIRAGSVWPPK